jgi:hypothetical protein
MGRVFKASAGKEEIRASLLQGPSRSGPHTARYHRSRLVYCTRLLQQEIEEERLLLARRRYRIAVGVEAVFCVLLLPRIVARSRGHRRTEGCRSRRRRCSGRRRRGSGGGRAEERAGRRLRRSSAPTGRQAHGGAGEQNQRRAGMDTPVPAILAQNTQSPKPNKSTIADHAAAARFWRQHVAGSLGRRVPIGEPLSLPAPCAGRAPYFLSRLSQRLAAARTFLGAVPP